MHGDKDSNRVRVTKETTAGIEWKGRVDSAMRLTAENREGGRHGARQSDIW
jgi:hypothetical protein